MNDAKEEIRSKLAIEDVVGEYVQLKRAGRYWKGLSPFTNEKSPSFFVTPERNIWHDFSSGKGGDIFSFIMEVEGLDFRGAMELLARKAGVDLSMYDTKQARTVAAQKERMYRMNELAVNYFQHCLTKSTAGINYVFKKRQLSKETVMEWGIGYAPERPELIKILESKHYKRDEIQKTGLASYRGGEMYRNRMMIPLRDGQGQVVGFTGRIIGDGQPKYLNTPATLLYDKGRQLFGLNFAKKAIRDNDFSVVVEGNLDVMSSHQAGIKNVVGVAGTALTVWHLKSLSRLSSDVRFCFDSDRAGVAATERAIKLAENLNLKLSVIDYSGLGAKDPDELIKQDSKLWLNALKHYKPAVEWVMDRYAEANDLSSAEGQKIVTTKTLDIVRHLPDPVEQEFYLKKLADMTGASLATLQRKMSGEEEVADRERPRLKPIKVQRLNILQRDENYYINAILALAYRVDDTRTLLGYLPDEYLDKLTKRVKYFILGRPMGDDGDQPMPDDLADKLSELKIIGEQDKVLAGQERARMAEALNNLEKVVIGAKLGQVGTAFAKASEEGNNELAAKINARWNELRAQKDMIDHSSPRNDYKGLKQIWQLRQKH